MAEARELLIKLTVDAAQADKRLKGVQKSVKDLDKSMKDASKSVKDMNSSFGSLSAGFESLKQAAGKLAAVWATVKGLKFAVDAKDQIDQLEGSFKALLGSSERAGNMMSEVFRVVSTTGADMESVGAAMQRLSIAMVDMGASNAQISRVSESFIKLGRVGGSSMADISGAMLQFTQALSSGKLQGDELRSIMERVPGVIKVIAEYMGVSAGEVRKLGSEGKITADIMANSLLKAAGDIDKKFKDLPDTSQQAYNRMSAGAVLFGKAFNDALNISGAWSKILQASAVGFETMTRLAQDFGIALRQGWVDYQEQVLKFAERFPNGAVAKFINVDELKKNIAQSKKETSEYVAVIADAQRKIAELGKTTPGNVGTINTKPTPGAGGKKDIKEKTDDTNEYVRALKAQWAAQAEIDALGLASWKQGQDRADAMQKEISALEDAVNPMRVYMREIERLNELKAAGLSDDAFAASIAKADENIQRASESLAGIQKPAQESSVMMDKLKDAIDGYAKDMAGAWVSALSSGKSFKESFSDVTASVLRNIAQLILQINVIEPLMKRFKDSLSSNGGSGGGIGGWISGLLSGWLGSAHGNAFAGATGLPYGVYNQPTFFPMPGNGPLQRFARGGVLGEAGPEAILPLRRTAGGKLGVQSTQPNVNVNVINNVGAAVSVSQDANGDTTVLIEKAKRAIANDIRRGGNDVAGAFESTYRVSRGG